MHDPKNIVNKLVSHLAAHDTVLSFLFGAGTSFAINIGDRKQYIPLVPSVELFTEKCKKEVQALGKEYAVAWGALEKECTGLKLPYNIETILSRVRNKLDALGDSDKSLGLNRKQLDMFEESMRKTILKEATPETIPDNIPHDNFARWVRQITRKRPVEIFTTNYDILIERSLELARIPVFDGFVGCHQPFFSAESIEHSDAIYDGSWAKLWKIHGSVNWHYIGDSNGTRVVRNDISQEGLMILPSHRKYDESSKQPYQALIDRLGSVLARDGSTLITCGFSFGDYHLNTVMFNALDSNALTHIICLCYEDIQKGSFIVDAASKRHNLIVIAPNAGVINGRWGEWKLHEPIDNRVCRFMDISFDSDAEPEKDKHGLTGKMRLGDFNWLCKFLIEMDWNYTSITKKGEGFTDEKAKEKG